MDLTRILCIDYGKKRCGIAVSDPMRIIASPLNYVLSDDLLSFVGNYMRDEEVGELVIGYPTHHDGAKTYLCKAIDEFLADFSKDFPYVNIFKVDESYSSVEAKKLLAEATTKKKKKHSKGELDKMSAVVILRRYMNF